MARRKPPAPSSETLCLHCQERKPRRGSRGLCIVCYSDLAVRLAYHQRKRGTGNWLGTSPLCLHCGANRARAGGRGLCPSCHTQPAIRAAYPALINQYEGTRSDRGDFCGNAPLDPCPTSTLPGTDAKIAVMAERESLGYAIFRPGDADGEADLPSFQALRLFE